MRIKDLLQKEEPAEISDSFRDAVEAWQEMHFPANQISPIILASPEAKPFMVPPKVSKIYRAVRKLDKPSRGKVITYSIHPTGPVAFAQTLGINAKWFLIEKQFKPEDFLLDFTAMIQHYGLAGYRDESEYEVWMKPTPYYANANESEVVDKFRSYA